MKILLVDDDESIRQTLTNYLTKLGYDVTYALNGLDALELFNKSDFDIVISDIKMPKLNGLDLLKEIKSKNIDSKVILITAHDDMQTTIKAMQEGAYEFLEKPIDIQRLKSILVKADNHDKLSYSLTSLKDESDLQPGMNIIGRSQIMKEVFKKIGQVSNNAVTVLLTGESGTGKELAAKAIHYLGNRANHPFIAVNCTALTETLLESELFGHEKGSFTGAIKEKKGKFELAGEGTVFLDEISEISSNLQIKLLRILQEKEFERVGGGDTIKIKARLITATNRNLESLVKEQQFREDLYYRLKVVNIDIPPLRNRKEDIPLLINYFLTKINNDLHKNIYKISDEGMNKLLDYDWPGNVRELENCLIQGVVLTRGNIIEKENLIIKSKEDKFSDYGLISLAEIEKHHILRVLNEVKWNKPKAAEILGISLPTLYSKIENYKTKQ